ncbi:MAG TPA: helix-turn-helix domain-containing protein [Flavisolibacter sp.]|nr:helix-turn-helix domain-containing protein [Flavisolibacter sp.]
MKALNKDKYYTITQLAKVLGASFVTVNKKVEAGEIPYTIAPLTGKKLFKKQEIETLFLKNTPSA